MSSKTDLLSLVRLGLGHHASIENKRIDWEQIKALAIHQGVSAVVLDGIEKLPEAMRPPKGILLEWIGESLHNYEKRYSLYCRAIAELAFFYNSHGFKMMVLKGYTSSLDWPKPVHRPCGDIDIWQFGKQKEADELLRKENGTKIDKSHHHHTVFQWGDFTVENHYDFINVHHHKSNAEFEKILKQLGEDDSHFVVLNGEKVYLPSPNLHALFLLKHLMMHFASEGIMLRQVVDWGFFVEKHGKDIDWNYVLDVLDEFGMHQMLNIINAICVGDLGFDAELYPQSTISHALKERVLNDIFEREFDDKLPKNMFKRICFKLIRWKANAWKHKLCYKDSMWSAFWSGIWNHLLKPSSI